MTEDMTLILPTDAHRLFHLTDSHYVACNYGNITFYGRPPSSWPTAIIFYC